MGDRLTRERVVDAAVAIVEVDGLAGLSMRTLCEKLGVSVTSIYWHVGNKEALLDALVERMQASIVELKPRGKTPRQRVRRSPGRSSTRLRRTVSSSRLHTSAVPSRRSSLRPVRLSPSSSSAPACEEWSWPTPPTRSWPSLGATRSCSRSQDERRGSKRERPSRGRRARCRSIASRRLDSLCSRISIGLSRPDSTPSSADSSRRNLDTRLGPLPFARTNCK